MKQSVKIKSTIYPPKQPSLIKWMQDFKVGLRIEMKSINDKAEQMNQFYDLSKIKL